MTWSQLQKDLLKKKHLLQDIFISTGNARPRRRSAKRPPPSESGLTEQILREDNTLERLAVAAPQVMDSSAPSALVRYSRHKLENMFGGHQVSDYKILTSLGDGIHVTNNISNIPSVGTLVNRKHGHRTRQRSKILQPNALVSMDIGYGPAKYPGAFKYVLARISGSLHSPYLDLWVVLYCWHRHPSGLMKILHQCQRGPHNHPV